MLKEINLKEALQAYLNGEIVLAMTPVKDGEERLIPIERLFDESRFLAETRDRIPECRKAAVPAMWIPVPNGER